MPDESQPTLEETMRRLGDVLTILAELHEDDRSVAYDGALDFYNRHNPDRRVEAVAGYSTRLQHSGPMDEALLRLTTEAGLQDT